MRKRQWASTWNAKIGIGDFAPPVNQEITIDDKAMAKALLEKLGIKAQINWGADTWSDCNIYTAADIGKTLYHRDVINAIKNYKG